MEFLSLSTKNKDVMGVDANMDISLLERADCGYIRNSELRLSH